MCCSLHAIGNIDQLHIVTKDQKISGVCSLVDVTWHDRTVPVVIRVNVGAVLPQRLIQSNVIWHEVGCVLSVYMRHDNVPSLGMTPDLEGRPPIAPQACERREKGAGRCER